MACTINCSISIIFLISAIWFQIKVGKDDKNKLFFNLLNNTQKEKYLNIINERFTLAMKGYALGILLSIIIIFYKYTNKINLSRLSLICLTGATTFITQYFFYIMSPKKNWMINSNLTKEQLNAWLSIYKHNQWNYHFGFILGIIAVLFLSNAFC